MAKKGKSASFFKSIGLDNGAERDPDLKTTAVKKNQSSQSDDEARIENASLRTANKSLSHKVQSLKNTNNLLHREKTETELQLRKARQELEKHAKSQSNANIKATEVIDYARAYRKQCFQVILKTALDSKSEPVSRIHAAKIIVDMGSDPIITALNNRLDELRFQELTNQIKSDKRKKRNSK